MDPTRQVTHEVECRLVRPVRVLDDEEIGLAGGAPRRASTTRAKTSWRDASSDQTPAGKVGSMSRSGASGAGVADPSQAPIATRARPAAVAAAVATKDVLPIPASPETKTSRPSPAAASSR